ncbi:hypothetical protein N9K75_03045 [bacterium]|nr:hypothetical protein [bacterium]
MITPIFIPSGNGNEKITLKEFVSVIIILTYFMGFGFGALDGFTSPKKFLKYKEVIVESHSDLWGVIESTEYIEDGLNHKKLFPNNASKVIFTYSAGAIVGQWLAQ